MGTKKSLLIRDITAAAQGLVACPPVTMLAFEWSLASYACMLDIL